LAAQEDGGTTPENVIAEQQGFLVYAAIVVNLDGIEKRPNSSCNCINAQETS
jgi:hypothetical protein